MGKLTIGGLKGYESGIEICMCARVVVICMCVLCCVCCPYWCMNVIGMCVLCVLSALVDERYWHVCVVCVVRIGV